MMDGTRRFVWIGFSIAFYILKRAQSLPPSPTSVIFYNPSPMQSLCCVFFVVAQAMLLAVRFVREEDDSGSVRLRRAHDYVASELNRLVRARAGAMTLIALAGILLGIKTRLFLVDGMLPAADLIAAMFQTCPGWARYDRFPRLSCLWYILALPRMESSVDSLWSQDGRLFYPINKVRSRR